MELEGRNIDSIEWLDDGKTRLYCRAADGGAIQVAPGHRLWRVIHEGIETVDPVTGAKKKVGPFQIKGEKPIARKKRKRNK